MRSSAKTVLCTALLFFCFSALRAQTTEARIRVQSPKNEPLSFATLKLVSVGDSSRLQQALSDSAGVALFVVAVGGQYKLSLSAVGYAPFEKGIVVKGANPEFNFTAEPLDKKLNTVVVTASRPLLRQEDDKTIVDPENLAATSTNSYEILEKTPGLFVDQDGNIYLNSTTPATVYINGREQRMSAADMATLLKNLPPNAIASIEILRTPSARYDASSSGGVVNVVLRKGVRLGLTGSVTLGGNQGRYGNQFVGFNLNNNNGALTTYLNLSYSRRHTFDELGTNRIYTVDSLLNQEAFTRYASQNAYIGFGLSYQFHPKWELSYDSRLSFNFQENRSTNFSRAGKIGVPLPASGLMTQIETDNNNYNITQGLNLKYKLDSAGSEWTTDLSFTYSPSKTGQVFNFGDGALDNRLRFMTAQTNYLRKLRGQVTVETGLKNSLVGFDNQTDYYRLSGSNRVKDGVRSGAYDYRERISSVYLQASKNFGGLIVKVGSRLENTNMQGVQKEPQDTSFSIQRTDLFPYVYLSRKLMSIAGYDVKAYLVYRRTISRPVYENLNPSLRFIDPFLYETGNPSLKPQFTNNYEANISVEERPIFAVGVNETRDIFNQVLYSADSSNLVTVRTFDNLGKNKETYLRLMGAIPPGKRYFFVVGAQYNHNFYQGVYEKNKPLSFRRGSWSLFTYQTFKISSLTQFSLNGFVRFKGQQQFYELSTFGMLNLNLTQQLLKKKLSVTVSMNDVFLTNRNEFSINQGSINAYGYRRSDTRRFGLNLRYNFGFRKKEENNMFNVESPEGK